MAEHVIPYTGTSIDEAIGKGLVAVTYSSSYTLNSAQQAKARENINAADAKVTGDRLGTLDDASLHWESWSPTLYQKRITDDGGIYTSSDNYQVHTWYYNGRYGTPGRYAVRFESDTYQFRVASYGANGSFGTGGVGVDFNGFVNAWTTGTVVLPADCRRFACVFKKASGSQCQVDTDGVAIQAALSVQVATDTTLSIAGRAADAKATGDRLDSADVMLQHIEDELAVMASTAVTTAKIADAAVTKAKLGYDVTDTLDSAEQLYYPTGTAMPTVIKGKGINIDNGKSYTNAKRARTAAYARISDTVRRLAVSLDDATYSYNVYLYGETGDVSGGSDFIRAQVSEYTQDMTIISTDAEKFVVDFKRTDNADLTDDDIDAIKAALTVYSVTDETLTQRFAPADAKATGDRLDSADDMLQHIKDELAVMASFPPTKATVIGNTSQGFISMSSGSVNSTSSITGVPNTLYVNTYITLVNYNAGYYIDVPEGYKVQVLYFTAAATSGYTGKYTSYKTGRIADFAPYGNRIRINIRKEDDTDLTPSDMPSITITKLSV